LFIPLCGQYLILSNQRYGVAIFILYLLQCGLGAIIHWVKASDRTRRPLQNYFHAIFGLLIIALAFYQVHSGYKVEWTKATGRDELSNGVNIFFFIWLAVSHLRTHLSAF
jgi:membrane associated rhomboid family serine protease